MVSFSVVVPVYNGARFVGDAIRSALDQSFRAHEIVVVNDGSTDNTLDVIDRFGAQIQLVNQPNAGVAAARNAGVRRATGNYVAFLDADDRWTADKLQVCADAIEALGADQAKFIFSNFVRENLATGEVLSTNTDLNPWIFEHLTARADHLYTAAPDVAFAFLLRGYPVYPSTMVVARDQLETIKWVEDFRLSEDFTFSLLNAAASSFAYIDKTLTVITRHDSNASLDHFEMAVSDTKVLEWALRSGRFADEKRRSLQIALGSRLAALGWNIRGRSRSKSIQYYARAFWLPKAKAKSLKGIARSVLGF